MDVERCAKCGGQVFLQTVIEEGRTARELACLQCGFTGECLPAPPIEEGHRLRRGGNHMGPRL
jgi:hypothetical protein